MRERERDTAAAAAAAAAVIRREMKSCYSALLLLYLPIKPHLDGFYSFNQLIHHKLLPFLLVSSQQQVQGQALGSAGSAVRLFFFFLVVVLSPSSFTSSFFLNYVFFPEDRRRRELTLINSSLYFFTKVPPYSYKPPQRVPRLSCGS